MESLLVLTTLPDAASASRIADLLVGQRLAACVSILSATRSVYRWQGTLEHNEEVPLLIKTTSARYAELEIVLRDEHPYELPEIVAVPVTHGLPAYLDWVAVETRAPS